MTTFSASTHSVLTTAGWHPGRRVITLGYRLALAVEGYPWFAAVEQFLQAFGGLQVSCTEAGSNDTFHFHARKAAGDVDSSWVLQNYAQRLGNPTLCVIGQAYANYLLLFMDDTGKVYGGYDDYLCILASSGEAAIEAICQRQPVQEIPDLMDE
ncbi:SUKH-3 domain-containing protein [Hymenobacter norwichensis]|uniref:SUKH-3 domain-containing protein n=1 Tax=Hymenobacter norwichensis TaxID=223903 RepID=UPI0009FC73C2|nr:SUKH-3 domain-containing protein [Hymenobacter norwichensis]